MGAPFSSRSGWLRRRGTLLNGQRGDCFDFRRVIADTGHSIARHPGS